MGRKTARGNGGASRQRRRQEVKKRRRLHIGQYPGRRLRGAAYFYFLRVRADVKKNKQNQPETEFYNTACNLRKDITNPLLRDFGVRDKVRKMKTENNLELTHYRRVP
jgi:hypothetical protein